jgi:hypothetical protein
MRRALKMIGFCFGALIVLLLVVIGFKSDFEFKAFRAKVTVDGKPSNRSSLYLNRWRQTGVVVRRDSTKQEFYAVSFRQVDSKGPWVLPCEDFAYIVLPGIAMSEHHSWAQACFWPSLTLKDAQGNILSEPKHVIREKPTVKSRFVEFVAEDGKLVRAEW